jgi:shikimate dehydrogenase
MLHDLVRSLASRVCGDLRAAFAGLQAQSGEPDPRGYDIVINYTPIGMTCSPGLPFEITLLGPGTVVVDLVVEPEMTELLQAAAAKGCLVQPGRRTLEGQVEAVCAFFLRGSGSWLRYLRPTTSS